MKILKNAAGSSTKKPGSWKRNSKKAILTLLLIFLIPITLAAQTSNSSSKTDEVTLPTGEKITTQKIQELFDRAGDEITRLRAENKTLRDLLAIRDEQLQIADQRIALLEETVALYRETVQLKDLAIKEYREALAAKDLSINERDKKIEVQAKRILELEKKRTSLWGKIKLILTGIGIAGLLL